MPKQLDFTEFSENQKNLVKDFINLSTSVDITLLSKDNPEFTTGSGMGDNYSIGSKVATRINELKKAEGGKLKSLESLTSIKGFGQDKLRDLVYTVSANFEDIYEKRSALQMIVHATDGTDGMNKGIHLRWFFDKALGFTNFRLCRRKSDLKNRHSIDFTIKKVGSPDKQFEFRLARRSSVERVFQKANVWSNTGNLKIVAMDRGTSFISVLDLGSNTNISFPFKTKTVELNCHCEAGAKVEITAQSGAVTIWHKKFKSSISRDYTIPIITEGITSLSITASKTKISKIFYWECSKEGNPWECFDDCGYGLPCNHKSTSHFEKFHQTTKNCDPNKSIAMCRLGEDRICSISENHFDQLVGLACAIKNEVSSVPVGWSKFDPPGNPNACSNSDVPEFSMTTQDMLLLQSQDPTIAKILGLYQHDQTVQDGQYYDYRIAAEWPDQGLWRLKNEVIFEEEGPTAFRIRIYT